MKSLKDKFEFGYRLAANLFRGLSELWNRVTSCGGVNRIKDAAKEKRTEKAPSQHPLCFLCPRTGNSFLSADRPRYRLAASLGLV